MGALGPGDTASFLALKRHYDFYCFTLHAHVPVRCCSSATVFVSSIPVSFQTAQVGTHDEIICHPYHQSKGTCSKKERPRIRCSMLASCLRHQNICLCCIFILESVFTIDY